MPVPTLDLSSIKFRSHQIGDEDETTYIEEGYGWDWINLSSIKFRAYQPPPIVEIDIGDGYSPGTGTGGSSGGIGDATSVSTYASLTTALSGNNNDLVFTAKYSGISGNEISITYIVSGLNSPLVVVVSGTSIVVYIATDGSGNPISTAAEIAAAIAANAAANDLVVVTYAPGNDGSGVVTAMATDYLWGGTGSAQPIQVGNPIPPTLNPFMANGIARQIPAIPIISTLANSSATASVNSITVLINGTQQTVIGYVKAMATASIAKPNVDPRMIRIASATASIIKPVIRVIPISTASIATATGNAPLSLIKVLPGAANASATAKARLEPTTVLIAAANASSVAPAVFAGVTIFHSASTATAASVSQNLLITVTTVATANASVVAPRRDPIVAAVAQATASITGPSVSAGDKTIITPYSVATASATAAQVLITIQSALPSSTASSTAQVPKVDVTAIATTTASVAEPTLIAITVVFASPAIANADQISLKSSVILGIREGVNATASAVGPNITTFSGTVVTTDVAISTGSIIAPSVSISIGAISSSTASSNAAIPIVAASAVFSTAIAEIVAPVLTIDATGTIANATASSVGPTVSAVVEKRVTATASIATANSITFSTSTILIVPRTVEATASSVAPVLNP